MDNKDYRGKIEEHRQSIEIEEQQNTRMSRSRRNVKANKNKQSKSGKKRKNPLMTILLAILLGIPSMFLIYVSFIYDPNNKDEAQIDKGNTVVELHTNNTVSSNSKDKPEAVVDKDDEESDEEQDTNEEIKNQAEADAAKLAEQQKQEQQKQEQQKQEQEKQEQQKQEQQKQEQQKQEQQKNENDVQQNQDVQQEGQGNTTEKVHTVQANENLFRIALKYGLDVETIKAANNLSSDSISVGQTLIIP